MLQRTDEIAVRVGPYDLSVDCLPDKPSALIRTAVADLERSLLNPRYHFNWQSYHSPSDECCGICLAGGVLAQSDGASPSDRVWSYGHHKNTDRKLNALSCFAAGEISAGLANMGECRSGWPHRHHNKNDLGALIPQLDTLIDDLEVAGL